MKPVRCDGLRGRLLYRTKLATRFLLDALVIVRFALGGMRTSARISGIQAVTAPRRRFGVAKRLHHNQQRDAEGSYAANARQCDTRIANPT